MTDKPELKPCPFGCDASVELWPEGVAHGYHKWCPLNAAEPIGLEVWNRRAPRFSPEERVALEQSALAYEYRADDAVRGDAIPKLLKLAATIRKMLEEK